MKTSEPISPNFLKSLEKRAALKSLLYLCNLVGFKDVAREVHGKLINLLTQIKHPKKLILLPRGTFKSSIITIAYIIYRILHNPNIRILVVSEVFDNAVKFTAQVKNIMETSKMFLFVFGNWKPRKDESKWTDAQFTVSRRTVSLKEPTVSAAGIDVVKVGQHYDLIILDDPISDKNCATAEQRSKVIDQYRLLHSILEPKGEMIIVGTRWHFDDLYGWILDNEPNLKAYIEKAIREDGSLFFPARLSKKYLGEQRERLGSYIYHCQYQNSPIDDEHQTFKEKWLQFYKPGDLSEGLYITMILDTAIAESKGSNKVGITLCGTDSKRNTYLLFAYGERINPTQQIDKVFELAEEFEPQEIGIEVVAYQKALKYWLESEMERRGKYLPIVELKTDTTKTKEMRIRALVPYFEYGKIYIKKEMQDFIDQYLSFPRSKYDDILDSLAYHLQIIQEGKEIKPKRNTAGTFKELMDKVMKVHKIKKKNPYMDEERIWRKLDGESISGNLETQNIYSD